jgi:predicted CoA-substrate-specific enzyme activase
MPVLGIDVGSTTVKAVIMEDGKILSSIVIPGSFDVMKTIERVVRQACSRARISRKKIDFTVATGYGRDLVPFADKRVTEITCHARGVLFLFPEARTILDIGGQDTKVIKVNEVGSVINFSMNDKCAAGTGRFFEVMANILEISVGEMGYWATKSQSYCPISSTCAVFAQTEVISLLAQGKKREDIIAGIHRSMVARIIAMLKITGYEIPLVLTGGVAKNVGVKYFLQKEANVKVVVPEEPQMTGALGAALIGESELKRRKVAEVIDGSNG